MATATVSEMAQCCDARPRRMAVPVAQLAADYRTAFGEEPGKLIAFGVMSDTGNTGESVEAWYGDISFSPVDR